MGGNNSGINYRATGADVQTPATVDQANAQYGNVQGGLLQQQNFVDAVRAQHGLQNQSDVYNQQMGIANGTGPNPAQAMLANSTGQNVASQAALMAGQRGSGANAGLLARQASMQGANIQQQAAGQGAALQANQSLNALNQAGGLATNQANQQANSTNQYNQNALAGQQNVLGAIGANNNARVGMQSNINTTNGALAGGVAHQQGNMLGGMMGGLGSVGGMFKGLGGGAGGIGASAGGPMAGGAGDAIGGGAGEAIGDGVSMVAAQGGMVPRRYADGGDVIANDQTPMMSQPMPQAPTTGPQSNVGKAFMQQQDDSSPAVSVAAPIMSGENHLSSLPRADGQTEAGAEHAENGALLGTVGGLAGGFFGSMFGGPVGGIAGSQAGKAAGKYIGGQMAEGGPVKDQSGKVPALVSPGETYLNPDKVKDVAKGANPLAVGEKIPGKPKVKGNSYANDIVPKDLAPGGIVIPNSIMQSKDAEKKAAAFVAAVLRKHRG